MSMSALMSFRERERVRKRERERTGEERENKFRDREILTHT